MDKLKALFVTEALELIADLERVLLEFEKDLHNEESVQVIFRVMHTLKGSASMFGFDTLSALTHDLETVYDAIRDGKIIATLEILDITLKSVDHLKKVIHDPSLGNSDLLKKHHDLLTAIKKVAQLHHDEIGADYSIGKSFLATYYIYCKPSFSIFKNGTNPLFLIDDLVALGDALVLPRMDLLPDFNHMNPGECYTSFEVILVTDKPAAEISGVFIFVEDACEIIIEKISEANLLLHDSFVARMKGDHDLSVAPFGLEIVMRLAENATVTPEAKSVQFVATRVDSSSIRVASDKLDELMNLVSELVTSQARLSLLAEQHGLAELTNVSENMEKITRRLRDNAFNICLVPIESLVIRFQRLVRDLSKELKKEIDFVAEGTDTELDRSIIEKVTDPILHILRNCLDHGIESPEERVRQGKKKEGKINLKAFHSGTSVVIQIKDDGRGVDIEKVRQKAIAKGLIKKETLYSEQEIIDLIFSPGFSTADQITDVSGRGVGMDIVRRNIESIQGEVTLTSILGQGTTISIKLPLTLSIVDGMLVQIGDSKYILPLTAIDKCYEIEARRISSDLSQKHVFDGMLLPVFNLHQVFREKANEHGVIQIIKIAYEAFPIGITVDQVIGEYQAVMKPLGNMYHDQDEFSGATILGDGSVALVIDTDKLIKQLTAKVVENNVLVN
ncbi:chemotaxis protein CheA [Chryseosolibacter indicus]|uniref:Chemotaxis protein CheA n=1 Tax=Chryseosolibacter indicus TaxID=2782351 RepID=A0ABS5VYI1_9BACT|nr:chemotaxis protein CheA [Chryseosolibacter indicus]MBT1705061.1 chemotaxis protein CheA [Chryseosolibacter indicus]